MSREAARNGHADLFRNVRSQGQSRKHVLELSFSGFDPGCVKLKNRNATKNDIFQFDLQVESACALSD
jgi:hypothetical protein